MKTKAERLAELRRRLEELEAADKAERDEAQGWREYRLLKGWQAKGIDPRARRLLIDSINRKLAAAAGSTPQGTAVRVERARELGRRGHGIEHAATVR